MQRPLTGSVIALCFGTGMLGAPPVERARISLTPPQGSHMTTPRIPDRASFSGTVDGKATDLYVLKNGQETAVAITNYGARVVSLLVRGRDGRMVDVVLGFDSLQGYLSAVEQYFGATIGRYANRIARGRFALDGTTFTATAPIAFSDADDVLWYADWNDPDTTRDNGLMLNDQILVQEGVTVINDMTVQSIASVQDAFVCRDRVSLFGGF